ncbi:MAG: DUF4398 domain-containing protein [Polyangiaceae bacterium]
MSKHLALFTLGFVALLGACGGAAVPHERVTSATAAVRAAEVGGAANNPEASLVLKRANDGLARAKALIADGDNEAADFELQRAEVDAELALNLAREAYAKAEAQNAIDLVTAYKKQSGK